VDVIGVESVLTYTVTVIWQGCVDIDEFGEGHLSTFLFVYAILYRVTLCNNASAVYDVIVCPSVRPSHAGIAPKRLDVG